MCIENKKCFNCCSMPLGVLLIGLSTVTEIGAYYLLDKMIMVIFPVLTILIFAALAFLRSKSWFRRVFAFAYLGITVIQVLAWGLYCYKTFFSDYIGRERC